MRDAILVINSGSSSVKFALFSITVDGLHLFYRGGVAEMDAQMHGTVVDSNGMTVHDIEFPPHQRFEHSLALEHLWHWLGNQKSDFALQAVGHRIVHGGMVFKAPTRITQEVIAQLWALVPLAPLHQPHGLTAIKTIWQEQPDLPQVACFDTAFHHTQSSITQMYGLPRHYFIEGIRRYGFHGLSYEYIASVVATVAPTLAGQKIIVAHLGNGASLCAIRDGKSVATTMGMTALDGLLMGTRCGSIDPGVVLYLLTERGLSATQLSKLLYQRSGLLGVSGISHDIRQLLDDKSLAANEALELFIYQINLHIGAMAAALGGVDGIIFTGGIGENSSEIRSRVCEAAAWLGIELDVLANQQGGPRLSTAQSTVEVWVIPTNEEKMIARHTQEMIR